MSESTPVPSQTAVRLAEMIKRSAQLAEEMKKTSEKMADLTAQMAHEAQQNAARAETIRNQHRKA